MSVIVVKEHQQQFQSTVCHNVTSYTRKFDEIEAELWCRGQRIEQKEKNITILFERENQTLNVSGLSAAEVKASFIQSACVLYDTVMNKPAKLLEFWIWNFFHLIRCYFVGQPHDNICID